MATLSTPWHKPEQGDVFRQVYLGLLPLLHYTYSAINPVAVKSLMQAVGLPSGPLRRPLKPVDSASLARGIRIMKELGLIERYGLKLAANLPQAAE
jgi:4-hydroxy-tetrahydrodipicolinate synthase